MQPTPSAKYTRVDLAVGLFVLAGLAALVWLAVKLGSGSLLGNGTFSIRARFADVGGIAPGASVLISGVPVGKVESLDLDDRYNAIATLRIRKGVLLPSDTMAAIRSSGLIGEKHIALSPGSEDSLLQPGETITDTESSVNLESLISRFAFGGVKAEEKK
jgi:phospholipid/cholesterol/gamma-HCH transport system substrate-binding protein